MSSDSPTKIEPPLLSTDADGGEEAQRAERRRAYMAHEDKRDSTTPAPVAAVAQGTPLRLNRFLASAGFGSRRSSEEHILKGRVVVNGSCCRDLSRRVSPEDDVRVNGRKIHQHSSRYFLLNKPTGYVCTRSDRFAERTIFDLLPQETATVFHVGRLDKESEGLLLVTNDGALAQKLLHPSHGVDKEYEVITDLPFTEKAAAALKKGTWIEGTVARVESVHLLGPCKIKLVLHQGVKRQIRVMLGQLGFKVKRLLRTRIGPLKLRQLGSGKYRELTPQELEALITATASPRATPVKKKSTMTPRPRKPFVSFTERADRPSRRPSSTFKKEHSSSSARYERSSQRGSRTESPSTARSTRAPLRSRSTESSSSRSTRTPQRGRSTESSFTGRSRRTPERGRPTENRSPVRRRAPSR